MIDFASLKVPDGVDIRYCLTYRWLFRGKSHKALHIAQVEGVHGFRSICGKRAPNKEAEAVSGRVWTQEAGEICTICLLGFAKEYREPEE